MMQLPATPTFPVVGIGGSAGGLPAYRDILGQMPPDSGMAIVIVSHRALNGSTGVLLALLAKSARMEVAEITDGMLLKPNRIFLAPPHQEVTTDGVNLRVVRGLTDDAGWPTVISVFLCSLAVMCTSRATAIIVSGMGFDGSSAFPAIKRAGGRTFAQSDACFSGMPQAAVATGCVDFILSAHAIGGHLARECTASPRVGTRSR